VGLGPWQGPLGCLGVSAVCRPARRHEVVDAAGRSPFARLFRRDAEGRSERPPAHVWRGGGLVNLPGLRVPVARIVRERSTPLQELLDLRRISALEHPLRRRPFLLPTWDVGRCCARDPHTQHEERRETPATCTFHSRPPSIPLAMQIRVLHASATSPTITPVPRRAPSAMPRNGDWPRPDE
jgi:hypothetical protein